MASVSPPQPRRRFARHPRLGRARATVLFAVGIGVAALLHAAAPPGSFTFPAGHGSWFGVAGDLDGDGSEELILATMGGSSTSVTQPPTPVYILAVGDGTITNRSDELFGVPPSYWSVRTIVPGDFNGDGQRDLLFCNEGRKPTDPALKTNPRTPGIWGEQSAVFFAQDGLFVDHTAELPQSVAFCHGASAANLDGSGRDALVLNMVGGVVNDSGGYPPYPPTYLAQWNGTAFTTSGPFTRTPARAWGFTTAAGDFNGDGITDVVGDVNILLGGTQAPRAVSYANGPLETTYTRFNGQAVGDVNNDGLADFVKVLSNGQVAEARFALYLGHATLGLVFKADGFPALASYDATHFGIDVSLMDINFDGFKDIVTFGGTYTGAPYPAGTPLHAVPNAVWLNDGTGRFSLAHFTDALVASSICGGPRGAFSRLYVLKTADPNMFNLVANICVPGVSGALATRTVTPDAPLTILP